MRQSILLQLMSQPEYNIILITASDVADNAACRAPSSSSSPSCRTITKRFHWPHYNIVRTGTPVCNIFMAKVWFLTWQTSLIPYCTYILYSAYRVLFIYFLFISILINEAYCKGIDPFARLHINVYMYLWTCNIQYHTYIIKCLLFDGVTCAFQAHYRHWHIHTHSSLTYNNNYNGVHSTIINNRR